LSALSKTSFANVSTLPAASDAEPLVNLIARRMLTSVPGSQTCVRAFNPLESLMSQNARLCAYSFICSKSDPHATNAGDRAIAAAVMVASGYPQKP
jgi:hypothetical protein